MEWDEVDEVVTAMASGKKLTSVMTNSAPIFSLNHWLILVELLLFDAASCNLLGLPAGTRKALRFWSLQISLYLELFCFLSLFLLSYVISAAVLAEDANLFE